MFLVVYRPNSLIVDADEQVVERTDCVITRTMTFQGEEYDVVKFDGVMPPDLKTAGGKYIWDGLNATINPEYRRPTTQDEKIAGLEAQVQQMSQDFQALMDFLVEAEVI